ncbi:hypothetical protein B0H13DRAFT_2336057 [Mycena leptocephala]|nr:hypothetical protein B0H13DRAFT_2336057 [Mycena leptocephala]
MLISIAGACTSENGSGAALELQIFARRANAQCGAPGKKGHTIADCFWPGGGKEGQWRSWWKGKRPPVVANNVEVFAFTAWTIQLADTASTTSSEFHLIDFNAPFTKSHAAPEIAAEAFLQHGQPYSGDEFDGPAGTIPFPKSEGSSDDVTPMGHCASACIFPRIHTESDLQQANSDCQDLLSPRAQTKHVKRSCSPTPPLTPAEAFATVVQRAIAYQLSHAESGVVPQDSAWLLSKDIQRLPPADINKFIGDAARKNEGGEHLWSWSLGGQDLSTVPAGHEEAAGNEEDFGGDEDGGVTAAGRRLVLVVSPVFEWRRRCAPERYVACGCGWRLIVVHPLQRRCEMLVGGVKLDLAPVSMPYAGCNPRRPPRAVECSPAFLTLPADEPGSSPVNAGPEIFAFLNLFGTQNLVVTSDAARDVRRVHPILIFAAIICAISPPPSLRLFAGLRWTRNWNLLIQVEPGTGSASFMIEKYASHIWTAIRPVSNLPEDHPPPPFETDDT